MKRLLIVVASIAVLAACSKEPGDVAPNGETNNSEPAGDAGDDASTSDPDVATANDAASPPDTGSTNNDSSECGDCSGDTPHCALLTGECVECLADNDCTEGNLLTCETFGDGENDPTFECVECVDDDQCAGATCDLDTHTCM